MHSRVLGCVRRVKRATNVPHATFSCHHSAFLKAQMQDVHVPRSPSPEIRHKNFSRFLSHTYTHTQTHTHTHTHTHTDFQARHRVRSCLHLQLQQPLPCQHRLQR